MSGAARLPSTFAEPLPDGSGVADCPVLTLLLHHRRHRWRLGDRRPVERYLEEHPALRDDPEAVLDLIYQEVLLREDDGEEPEPAEYLARFPELAPQLELQFEFEAAIRPSPLLKAGERLGSPSVVPASSSATEPRTVADYEVLGELGRGGMGIVYKARQLRLNRVVALKMILAGAHASPESAERFRAEAEAVARLQHPNIVRIHACGDHDGRPFFAMEYVDGGSLADRLDGTPKPARFAAELIATLASAMNEAHRLGIVHRDLKPANVLLMADGTPKIADFGLAKCVGSDSDLTGTRSILGSPSYMAPEQVGGSPKAVGPPTDVYALGAILYETLTGRPPFAGETALETLEQVREREPVPPSRLLKHVPRDLETICLKCLHKEMPRRYSDMEALAADLERFLQGQPILARPVTRFERLRRWCRREPAKAGLAAGLILTLTLGVVGIAAQWRRAEANLKVARFHRTAAEANYQRQLEANGALRRANDREAFARRRAQERFDAAMRAFRVFELAANDAALLREPHMEDLRKRLLQASLRFYRELQASLEEDASLEARGRLAEAYARAGLLSSGLGLHDEALTAHTRALALTEQMAVEAPADIGLKAALARGHVELGIVLNATARPAEALLAFETAREIQTTIVRSNPFDKRAREVLSWTLGNLGVTHLSLGRPVEAARLHGQVIEIREALLSGDPGNNRYLSNLAWSLLELGLAREATGEMDRALELLERAASLQEEVVRRDSSVPENLRRFAWCLDAVGRLRMRLGRAEAAADPLEKAAEYRQTLVRRHPSQYREDLAHSYIKIAIQRASARRPKESLAHLRRAETLIERIPTIRPGLLYDLACAYSICSGSAHAAGSVRESIETTNLAVAKLRQAVESGLYDLDHVRRDPDLDPIRSSDGFRLLLLDLAMPSDPFSPFKPTDPPRFSRKAESTHGSLPVER